MVDDTVPPVNQNDVNTMLDYTGAINNAKTSIDNFGQAGNVARGAMDFFNAAINKAGISLSANQTLTQNQTKAFGLLTSSVFGARDAFKGLASDAAINTFGSQFKDLQTVIAGSPIANQIKNIVGFLRSVGAPIGDVSKAVAGGIGALSSYAEAFIKSADNGLRLQNAIVQLGASTGTLNSVYAAAGTNLKNINMLLSQHEDSVMEAMKATG